MSDPSAGVSDLILSLEQATFMAKQLQSTTHRSSLLQIYTSLHSAHHNLSNFLSLIDFPPRPPPENHFSSAAATNPDETGGQPMEVGGEYDEVEAEEEISKVQDKMRDCFIKNKRQKRPLSPSATAAEERRFFDDGFVDRVKDFDAHAMRLKALDLVYQFHG
ncbi:AP2/ERF transcription factor SNZ [Senna tora]|uniref:AP2/ERF transcription factor SNZ n=1 Tax=Senna tora TaxID=362788 RepID=A0A835CBH1_9FABA|nr:AP2/ERF transcription factor SNZ [Senna tora]